MFVAVVVLALASSQFASLAVSTFDEPNYVVYEGATSVDLTVYSSDSSNGLYWMLDGVVVDAQYDFGWGSTYSTPNDLALGLHEVLAVDSSSYVAFYITVYEAGVNPSPSPLPTSSVPVPTSSPTVKPSSTPYPSSTPVPTVSPTPSSTPFLPVQTIEPYTWFSTNPMLVSMLLTLFVVVVFFLLYWRRLRK